MIDCRATEHSHTISLVVLKDQMCMVFACSRASQMAQVVKNLPANAGDIRDRCNPWVGKVSWRRKWKPTPVFLPGESHRQRNLAGYGPWSCKESESPCSWNFPGNNTGLSLSTDRSINGPSSSSSSVHAGWLRDKLIPGLSFLFWMLQWRDASPQETG